MSRQSLLDREEARICEAYDRGELSREEYNAEMRELQQQARECYEMGMDMEDARERVRDDWGW